MPQTHKGIARNAPIPVGSPPIKAFARMFTPNSDTADRPRIRSPLAVLPHRSVPSPGMKNEATACKPGLFGAAEPTVGGGGGGGGARVGRLDAVFTEAKPPAAGTCQLPSSRSSATNCGL